jgi:hypothetical protein
MPLTRLDNLISSKSGKYLYVSPDDFNASDSLDNRGNSLLRPFKSIQRAFLEAARFSYLPDVDNDRFDQFSIMLAPGEHYIDNRPGIENVADLPIFQYNQSTGEWEANENVSFDLSDPDNILYKFNGREGGATIPRGTSLVGSDLRRTHVRPLYVPDPADKDIPRTALFNVTGGCYFWQFTIFDGDLENTSPLFDVGSPLGIGKVYTQPNDNTNLAIPEFSHHKITNFVFADKEDLGLLYRKIARVFSDYQPAIDDVYVEGSNVPVSESWDSTTAYSVGDRVLYNGKAYVASQISTNVIPSSDENKWNLLVIRSREFDFRVQENRIVGPLQDAIRLDEIKVVDSTPPGIVEVSVRTKINHGFFPGQYVAIANNGLNVSLNGVFKVYSINPIDPKEFTYRIQTTATGLGLVSGTTYTASSAIALDPNATVQAEVDSVESASPYVFNVSIRSTWGICGIWADGRKATGFKSMVIAQYTGVSLQRDDRAFIRYDEFSNTWNQAPLTDAFATTPYHIKGDAYWKDDWRNFHVRASDDSFIQNVSIFAVGFADHFLLESGGDMSITNSNSNFGNTSMHSVGYKGFAFNQDKGGYITDIVPPKALSTLKTIKNQYYVFDVQKSKVSENLTKLYLGSDDAIFPDDRPAATISGYRLGAKRDEKIYVKLDSTGAKEAKLKYSGFKKWVSSLTSLKPTGDDFTVDYNLKQDAANLIESNKEFIQAEAFGYILEKFPDLQNISYVNPNITSETGRYRDASNLIRSNRDEIIQYAYSMMIEAYPNWNANLTGTAADGEKCKRDLGYFVDGLADDLYNGGNAAIVEVTRAYFDGVGDLIDDGLVGEIPQSVYAFRRAKDWAKKAISNLLGSTSILNTQNDAITSSGLVATVTTVDPHNLVAGDIISISGATQSAYNGDFTVLATGLTANSFTVNLPDNPGVTQATGEFYVSTIQIDPNNNDNPAGRYKDASGLITANRQEIIDRAEAAIALSHPDFYYPGDAQTNAFSRYKDSYRLIQLNKQEIIDRAAAEIAIQHPDFYYPGDAQTLSSSRYKDAYRLIQLNRQEIINGAYAQIAISHPGFVNPDPAKCQRDIGYFIDAISLDISLENSNQYSRKFIQQYFNQAGNAWITNGLQGEETQSNTAFNKARDLMKLAVANQLTVKDLTVTADPLTGSNTDPASCANVQLAITTLTTIVTSSVSAGNLSSLPAENTGTVPEGEVKCKRDIGFFIDAVSLDLSILGNVYSRKFALQYFDENLDPLSNGLVGEEAESIVAFNKARDMMKLAVANQLYSKDLTLTADPLTGSNTDPASCDDVQASITTLTNIVTTAVSSGDSTDVTDITETRGTPLDGEAKCRRDIGFIVDSIAQDLFWGGNEFTVDATREYYANATTLLTNGLVDEVTESVTAFNAARDAAKKAVTNQLYSKNFNLSFGPPSYSVGGSDVTYNESGNASTCIDVQDSITNLFGIVTTTLVAGNLNNLPVVTNGSYDCANVRYTIDTLSHILITALSNGNLSDLPVVNPGQWSQVSEASKCKRDIGYIVEAVVSDLRLGGNENVINAAEAYYTAIPLANDTTDGNQDGFTLDYIENEKTETLEAWKYVRNLAISAMRNHDTYITGASTVSGSSIVTVPSTIGLAIGMKVESVNTIPADQNTVVSQTSTIPDNAYIKKIGDGQNGLAANQIQLGVYGSRFDLGTTVNATSTLPSVNLYVKLETGVWSTDLEPTTDEAVIQDYNYTALGDGSISSPGGECASVVDGIIIYFNIIDTILNSGIGTVPRVPSVLSTASLAQRATLFNLVEKDSQGNNTTNPHDMETGTPVRLVPRAKKGTNPDKRLIRLPKGFDTNTTYYVIAPGRKTDPFDYSNSIGFNGDNQQTLLLATSEENSCAGIYIYSPETDSIDKDVEIDVYQYLLDTNYDLHRYQTNLLSGSSTILETDRPHVFDVPSDNITPQRVFFRTGADITGSSLPTLASNFGGTVVDPQTYYYARYSGTKTFTIHLTFTDAIDNINPVTFAPGSTAQFYTYADKRRSPLKYDAAVGDEGLWYIETLESGNQILPRIKQSDYETRLRTTDSWYERIEDNRTPEDRIYRFRYVIPKNLKTVRDPLNGFVFKIRTDEKRRLLPQKIVLKPTAAGNTVATFNAPTSGERLGLTKTELVTLDPNFVSTYDPYNSTYAKRIETTSKVAFTIQSAKKKEIQGKEYLELTVFDIGVDNNDYKTKLFTTVKIDAPEGGDGIFVNSIANSNNTNKVTWDGNSKGTAYVHSYFAYENNYYMILKDFSGNSEINYSPFTETVFTQGDVTATLLENPNGGRNDIKNNLYVIEGANTYTVTPGDTVNDDNGVSYTVASVEDVSDMESTFYIFDIDEIRRRIPGQQDGVYYLTCVRGDISPYPTGSGVGTNFKNFKFSQPISKIYPEFYKNDPEWYKGIDPESETLLDPPATISAADNYVHGLVTVNDAKGSLTKETILDFIADPGTGSYTYSGENAVQAQNGSASAGSESRKIPIGGDSDYPLEQKVYLELRRPSIARSGNHTFEYLGFGPGNYSTGFPARQEVVLTDTQDFYAQAKRENAGIVFYTGLNSNGDLYIGNRKINAITGEETFLESAQLVESADDADNIGTLVTTFDSPVTFNDIITVNGVDGSGESTFNSPLIINNATAFGTTENYPSLKVVTGSGTAVGYDAYLEFNISGQKTGDILIHQNTVTSAIFDFNTRGSQDYTMRVALSNRAPDFANTFGTTTNGPTQTQNTNFGSKSPLKSGDMQFKGLQTLFTGSLGWIFANDYVSITTNSTSENPDPQLLGIQGSETGTKIRLNYNTGVSNNSLGITASSQIRIQGATGSLVNLNGVWSVVSDEVDPFDGAADSVVVRINTNLPVFDINQNNANGYPVNSVAQPSIEVASSRTAFKEFGVIGAEVIRTETSTYGDFKLGINTVARAAHSAYQTAWVSEETEPRANLDVVGNTYISGRSVPKFLTETTNAKTELAVRDAFIVGGNSETPGISSALRVATTSLTIQSYNNTSTTSCTITTVESHGLSSVDTTWFANVEFKDGPNSTKSGVYRVTAVSGTNTITITNQTGYELSGLTVGNTAYATGNITLTRGNQTNSYTVNESVTGSLYGRLGVNTTLPVLLEQLTKTGSTVTVLTRVPHGFFDGENVKISVSTSGYTQFSSNSVTITNCTEDTFDFTTTDTTSNFNATTVTGYVSNEALLDREFVVRGDGRLTGNLEVKGNTTISGTNLDTTNTTLNLYNTTATTVNAFGDVLSLDIGNNSATTGTQTIDIGNYAATQTLTVGDAATTSNLYIHRNSKTSVIDIGTVSQGTLSGGVLHNSQVTIGGAWNNTTGFFRVGNRNSIFDSDSIEIGAGPSITSSQFVRIFTQANELRLFDTGGASIVQLCRNAGELSIASDGGTTTINNSLLVKASQQVDGNIILNGGLNSGTVEVVRGAWGTTAVSHSEGSIQNRNIDFYKYTIINKNIDAGSSTYWGGTQFQVSGSTTSEYFLGLDQIATANDFSVGDYILVDRARHTAQIAFVARNSNVTTITTTKAHGFTTGLKVEIDCSDNNFDIALSSNVTITVTGDNTFTFSQTGTNVSQAAATGTVKQPDNQAKSELLKVTEITNISNTADPNGLRIKVLRAQDGTVLRTDHPDGVLLSKFVKFDNASWIINDGGINTTEDEVTTAEFGGAITTNDYLRLSDLEIVKVAALLDNNIQVLRLTDGGDPAVTKFEVESTTGSLTAVGSIAFGLGADASFGNTLAGKFTVAASSGNTNIAGTLTVENTLTLNGSTTVNTQFFKITNGAASPAIKFQVDTANGNTIINGGNFNIFAEDGTTSKLSLNNSSGDIVVAGTLSANGSGTNTYAGNLLVNGSGTQGGNLTVQQDSVTRFKVNNTGTIDLGGITSYYGTTGARRWVYVNATVTTAVANVNYFVAPSAITLIKLPTNPVTGDMIRFVDIGGNLTYNVSLVMRAPTGIAVQGDVSNTGSTILGGTFTSSLSGYDGGELVIQTPNAGFGLIYAGSTLNDGSSSSIPNSAQGWWLVEI